MAETRPPTGGNLPAQSHFRGQGIQHSGSGPFTVQGDLIIGQTGPLPERDQQRLRQECHQLFRLTSDSKDSTYEWYKERVENRVAGTCQWFLNHEHFQTWLKQDSGPLLVSADPGCGKSVLAKYLIDEGLPQSAAICYFFFKDQDQNTMRQALCALLHQLFSLRPSLIRHAMPEYLKNGSGLMNTTTALRGILKRAVRDSHIWPLIIVLDALDECAESDFPGLIWMLKHQFLTGKQDHIKVKWLVTSRPYEHVISEFQDLIDTFPYIRIPGEDESETISQEVNLVIEYRVDQLAREKRLSEEIRGQLTKRLLGTPHRTYLWACLVLNDLKTSEFKKTEKGINSFIATLPANVNQAYEKILNKSKDKQMIRKILGIILAANRPLTVTEMNFAVNIDSSLRSMRDLDLEEEEDFRSRLRSLGGLFISIFHGKVYFLHQTAREFLLASLSSPTTPSALQWHQAFTIPQAHAILAEACVVYLDFLNSDANRGAGKHTNSHAFLDYSAKNWGSHFREANIPNDAAILPFALRICNPNSKSYLSWFKVYWQTMGSETPSYFTDLMVASYFGHNIIVKGLLATGKINVNSKDNTGRTPLTWAAAEGHEGIVTLLLATLQTPLWRAAANGLEGVVKLLSTIGKVEVDPRDKYGGTPLSYAAENGHEGIVKLLLATGKAEADSKDTYYGMTPLSYAAVKGHEGIVKLLLATGKVEADSEGPYSRTPLSYAAEIGNEGIVKLLLATGKVKTDSMDWWGRTPLVYAASNGHEGIVKLLFATGNILADKSNRWDDRTPLSYAAENGYEGIVKLLLATGKVQAHFVDDEGRAPLSYAAENGHEGIVKLLLAIGKVQADSGVPYDRTPLSYAAENGHEGIVKLLLATGKVTVNSKDNDDRTPLSYAAENGHEGIVKLLLATGNVEADSKDRNGRTPLSYAAENGYEGIVKLLLATGKVKPDSKDRDGQTPLWYAAGRGHEGIAKLLLATGKVKADPKGKYGRTPLSCAAENGHEGIAKLLLATGKVRVNSKDKDDRTPLSYAAANGHEGIVKLLLATEKVEADSKGGVYDQTPLSYAAERGHEGIVKLLLATGKVTVNSKDKDDRTPLSYAASNDHEGIVKLLLATGKVEAGSKG